jgi:hypothetical protein
MSFRSTELAIQPKTKNRLYLALKLFPEKSDDWALEGGKRTMTIDELGDLLLNKILTQNYPAVIELEKTLAKVEREAIEKAHEQARDQRNA